MSVVNLRRYSLKNGLPKSSDFADILATPPPPNFIFKIDPGDTNCYSGGSNIIDLSGLSTTGSLINSPTFNSEGSFTFNGTNQYIEFPTSSQFVQYQSNTFMAWVTKTSFTDQPIITKAPKAGSPNNYPGNLEFRTAFGQNKLTVLSERSSSGLGGSLSTDSAAVVNTNFKMVTWVNTYNPGTNYTSTLYVNNTSFTSDDGFYSDCFASTTRPMWVGAKADNTFWAGKIGVVTLFDSALTADQILTEFNNYKTRYGY